MKVHDKIRFMRQSKNWSQEEMANKLNMSVNGYGKIEQGKTDTTFSKLEQIAGAFEIDLMELMSLGEKHLYLVSGDNHGNNGYNVIGSAELAFEIQKLQLIVTHKDETIEHLKQDIARLTEILELYKKSTV
jgi:transcriptional regulator with XRE-family HTH domain